MKVKLYDPVVVAVALKPEKWGFFQFPNIYRDKNDALIATWSMAPDAVSSYGIQEAGHAVSTDGGKSWSQWKLGIPPVGGGIDLTKWEPNQKI